VPIRGTELCESCVVGSKPGAFFFADVVNPTAAELRAWAYAGADEPIEDFEMMLDATDVLPVVIECAADPLCPEQDFMLRSLYCTVGHLQVEDRARVRAVAASARESSDAAVRTWAARATGVIDGTQEMNRPEWCGWPSLAVTNPVDPGA
jgi:hypothetical protein